MQRRTLRVLLGLVFLSACDDEFKPETEVAGLRVLGLRASPAELAPGQTAALAALVEDPTRPGQKNTLLWLGCEPDPYQGRSPCSDTAFLGDPTQLIPVADGSAPQLPPGMSIIGFDDHAAYSVRADLFGQLASSDPRRKDGTVGQVVLFAIGADVNPLGPREEMEAVFEKVRNRQIPSVITLFRLRVSEDAQPNTNPVLGELRANGEALAPGATLRLASNKPTSLELTVPDESLETYTQVAPNGTVETKTEQLISAWYSTSGRFEPGRVALRSGTPLEFRPPDATSQQPFPEDRRGTLWTVVRDTRGGQSWWELPFFLCDERQPAPKVTAVETQSEGLVVLRGEHLSSVLDVLIGGRALERGSYSPVRDTYEALLPVGTPAGEYEVVVRGKHCQDETLAQHYTVHPP
ncbi:hypothetical protein [Vitiosangium sp. GDMCC 1.1324]|uniref:hypothetical protein n=1 Tax=Vitiosangium sp. (strain GDMCC 1.1324) TaxID=2138576 RepID=UPI000D38C28D|nr:hypothetical protein [Vitiosangium sp. GDMCC 1.1324]PTL81244.1 hypothetical protein DAT35_24300 [Vitiosangium sp. GDMCC 1.1324]